MRLENTREYILSTLKRLFEKDEYYHGLSHAVEVENACVLISKYSNIKESDQELLRIAALCHDIGHSESFDLHEVYSCKFVEDNLAQFGYSKSEIDHINSLIMSTKFPHQPTSILEEIICDADLSYIGTYHYFTQVGKLRKELKEKEVKEFQSEESWIEFQLRFLVKHQYYTEFARQNFDEHKNQVIANLKSKL